MKVETPVRSQIKVFVIIFEGRKRSAVTLKVFHTGYPRKIRGFQNIRGEPDFHIRIELN